MNNTVSRASLESDRANIKQELHVLYGVRRKTKDDNIIVRLKWHEKSLKEKLAKIEQELGH